FTVDIVIKARFCHPDCVGNVVNRGGVVAFTKNDLGGGAIDFGQSFITGSRFLLRFHRCRSGSSMGSEYLRPGCVACYFTDRPVAYTTDRILRARSTPK